jgi:hypothetical protein
MAIGSAVGAVVIFAVWRDALMACVWGGICGVIVGDLWPVKWMER